MIIEFADPQQGGVRRTATFLPEVAAHEGWDQRQVGAGVCVCGGCEGEAAVLCLPTHVACQPACQPVLQPTHPPARLQTLHHLVRKAGYAGAAAAVLGSLRVTRYRSTAFSLTYAEYARGAGAADGGSAPWRRHASSARKPQLVTVTTAQ